MYLFLALILATEVIDIEMTPQDKKKTGLYKLTEKERTALQLWVDNNYEKRPTPVQKTPPAQKPTVSEVLQSGKFVRLSDNSLWEIKPEDRAITQSWITVVEILVDKSGDPQYPSKLTNTLTGSSVRAKQVTIPPSQKPPTNK